MLQILIYQRDDYNRIVFSTVGIQDELEESTDDGVQFRVAVQFSGNISSNVIGKAVMVAIGSLNIVE